MTIELECGHNVSVYVMDVSVCCHEKVTCLCTFENGNLSKLHECVHIVAGCHSYMNVYIM